MVGMADNWGMADNGEFHKLGMTYNGPGDEIQLEIIDNGKYQTVENTQILRGGT